MSCGLQGHQDQIHFSLCASPRSLDINLHSLNAVSDFFFTPLPTQSPSVLSVPSVTSLCAPPHTVSTCPFSALGYVSPHPTHAVSTCCFCARTLLLRRRRWRRRASVLPSALHLASGSLQAKPMMYADDEVSNAQTWRTRRPSGGGIHRRGSRMSSQGVLLVMYRGDVQGVLMIYSGERGDVQGVLMVYRGGG